MGLFKKLKTKLNLKIHKKKFLLSLCRNTIELGERILISGFIKGKNNTIIIENDQMGTISKVHIEITGDNNTVIVKNPLLITNLKILFGLDKLSNSTVFIDEGTSIGDVTMNVYQNNSEIKIGKDCMLSWGIIMYTGEVPHLLFDKNTGKYLDTDNKIELKDHVWLGQDVMVLKKTCIQKGSIVGGRSTVGGRFDKENVLIAGNPAKIRKESVEWVRHEGCLEENSTYKAEYQKWKNSINS